MTIALMIDHTNLKPDATEEDIRKLCVEARTHGFASVCVLPCRVPLAVAALKGSSVAVCTVVGFPLGSSATDIKVAEAVQALDDGATEIDMVVNIGWIKDRNWHLVRWDIEAVCDAFYDDLANDRVVKVIFETDLLTDEEKIHLAKLCGRMEVGFVKTSTGTVRDGRGATVADVALMNEHSGPQVQVKASGGIRTLADAQALVAAGATRLGTSAGVAIALAEQAGLDVSTPGSQSGY